MLLSLPFCITSTVKTSYSSSKLQLGCLYSELSQVQSAKWTYQNKSHQLRSEASDLGSISTSLPLPITSDTAGNYTCTLQLKNGQTVQAMQAVTLPHEGGRNGLVSQTLVCFLIFFINSILWAQESWQTSCQLSGDNEPWMWMIFQVCALWSVLLCIQAKLRSIHLPGSAWFTAGKAPDRYHMLWFLM